MQNSQSFNQEDLKKLRDIADHGAFSMFIGSEMAEDIKKQLNNDSQTFPLSRDQAGAMLVIASALRDVKSLECLLNNGANIEAKDKYDDTPLATAAYKGYIEIVKFLVENGANVEAKNKYGNTSLKLAADMGARIETIEFLVEHGANIEAKDEYGNTSLKLAAAMGARIETIKFLVENGASVESFSLNSDGTYIYTLITNPCPEMNNIIKSAKQVDSVISKVISQDVGSIDLSDLEMDLLQSRYKFQMTKKYSDSGLNVNELLQQFGFIDNNAADQKLKKDLKKSMVSAFKDAMVEKGFVGELSDQIKAVESSTLDHEIKKELLNFLNKGKNDIKVLFGSVLNAAGLLDSAVSLTSLIDQKQKGSFNTDNHEHVDRIISLYKALCHSQDEAFDSIGRYLKDQIKDLSDDLEKLAYAVEVFTLQNKLGTLLKYDEKRAVKDFKTHEKTAKEAYEDYLNEQYTVRKLCIKESRSLLLPNSLKQPIDQAVAMSDESIEHALEFKELRQLSTENELIQDFTENDPTHQLDDTQLGGETGYRVEHMDFSSF